MLASYVMSNVKFTAAAVLAGFGLMAAMSAVSAPPTLSDALLTVMLGSVLAALTVIDLASFRLPDRLTLPLMMFGCVVLAPATLQGFGWRCASALMGYLSLFVVRRIFYRLRGIDGLGLGDAKLFAAGGAWVGMEALPGVLLIASTLALAAVGVAFGMRVKIDRSLRVPFGPFLAIGIWIVWLGGPLIFVD